MKKRTILIWIIVVAAVGWGAGQAFLTFYRDSAEFVVSGIVEADDIHVGSKVGGRVLRVVAREGQMVKANDPLVVLEPNEINASFAEAQAMLRQAEARLSELMAGYRTEEIDQAEASAKQFEAELDQLLAGPRPQEMEQARAEWLAAKAQHENAQRFQRRMKDLAGRQLVARQEYDDAMAKAEEFEQKTKSAKERYDLLLAGTRKEEIARARQRLAEAAAKLRQLRGGYRKEEIAQARAGAEMARARVQLFKTRLEETVVRSPVDALVEVLDLQPGDLVEPGKPVATLIRTGQLWVRAYLSEDRLGQVQPGLKVKVRVDSFPGRTFAGAVRRLHRRAEFTPRNVQTREERVLQVFQTDIDVEDPEGVLRPGMNADVFIKKSEK